MSSPSNFLTPVQERFCVSWTAEYLNLCGLTSLSPAFSFRNVRCRFEFLPDAYQLRLVREEGRLNEPIVITVLVERDGLEPQVLACEGVAGLNWKHHIFRGDILDRYTSFHINNKRLRGKKRETRFVFIFGECTTPVQKDNIQQPIQEEIAKISSDFPSNLENLSLDFANLLKNETLPDVVLKCGVGNRAIPAHRAVLAARSEVFAAMFRNEMAESLSREVDVPDVGDDVMHPFLQYVYSGRISLGVSDEVVPGLYAAADKYAVHALRETCRERMVKGLTQKNCVDYLTLADAHGDAMFKKSVTDFICSHDAVLKGDAWREFSKKQPSLAIEVYDCFVEIKSNVVWLGGKPK